MPASERRGGRGRGEYRRRGRPVVLFRCPHSHEPSGCRDARKEAPRSEPRHVRNAQGSAPHGVAPSRRLAVRRWPAPTGRVRHINSRSVGRKKRPSAAIGVDRERPDNGNPRGRVLSSGSSAAGTSVGRSSAPRSSPPSWAYHRHANTRPPCHKPRGGGRSVKRDPRRLGRCCGRLQSPRLRWSGSH